MRKFFDRKTDTFDLCFFLIETTLRRWYFAVLALIAGFASLYVPEFVKAGSAPLLYGVIGIVSGAGVFEIILCLIYSLSGKIHSPTEVRDITGAGIFRVFTKKTGRGLPAVIRSLRIKLVAGKNASEEDVSRLLKDNSETAESGRVLFVDFSGAGIADITEIRNYVKISGVNGLREFASDKNSDGVIFGVSTEKTGFRELSEAVAYCNEQGLKILGSTVYC